VGIAQLSCDILKIQLPALFFHLEAIFKTNWLVQTDNAAKSPFIASAGVCLQISILSGSKNFIMSSVGYFPPKLATFSIIGGAFPIPAKRIRFDIIKYYVLHHSIA